MAAWRFDVEDPAWSLRVDAVPDASPDPARAFWEVAVPSLAAASVPQSQTPVVVVARCTARAAPGRRVAGPRGRAKGLLDALHSDRRSGPTYSDLGALPPLVDDHPRHVRGLAVEVVGGGQGSVDYRVGSDLRVTGELVAELPVGAAAPNDVDEAARLVGPRAAFAAAIMDAWSDELAALAAQATAIVVRHHTVRDEDNTWAAWAGALLGARWMPRALAPALRVDAFASVADNALATPTLYEFYV